MEFVVQRDLRGNKQDFEAEINAWLQQHPGIKVVDNKQSASDGPNCLTPLQLKIAASLFLGLRSVVMQRPDCVFVGLQSRHESEPFADLRCVGRDHRLHIESLFNAILVQ
jgi:hypothetical protein